MTTVECFERKVSSFLRKWLGLPRSLSSIALYGRNNKLKLPFSSLTEEFMVTRAREVLLYRDSSDTKVSSAGIEVRTGKKWKAQEAVDQAEARLRHSELVGTVAAGRQDSGATPRPSYNKAQGKERRQLIQEEVRAGVDEARCSRVVGMRQQGRGPVGRRQLTGRYRGQSYGELSHTGLSSSSSRCTMSSQALPTSTAGAWRESDVPSLPKSWIAGAYPELLPEGAGRWALPLAS